SSAQGTVPYLGIFLTDLTMLDTAVKDRLDNGYINFDKRRREFEVLAQIRLLQSSCKNCIFTVDKDFVRWYQSVPTLTEEESLRSSQNSLVSDSDNLFDFPSPVNHLLSKLTKSHRRSASCGNNPTG
ncbi:unnamed protein product, partial [Tetraodon nigroviridis]